MLRSTPRKHQVSAQRGQHETLFIKINNTDQFVPVLSVSIKGFTAFIFMVKTGLDFILTSQTEIISRVSEKTKAQNVPDIRKRERDPDVHDSEAQQQLDETLFRNRIIGTNIMMVKQTRGLLRIASTLALLVDEGRSEHRWRLFQSVSH